MHTINKTDIKKKWYIIDMTNKILGRISVKIATILTGKNKPEYIPYKDCGDNLILINSDKFIISGKKKENKIYYTHSGHIGNLKKKKYLDEFKKDPKKIILKSIKGMLPKSKLGKNLINNVYIYKTEIHNQIAQKPELIR